MAKTPRGYLTKSETAERVGHTPHYVMILVGRGDFPTPLRVTVNDPARARVYFRKSEVREWVRQRDGREPAALGRKSVAGRNPRKITPIGERFMTMERTLTDLLSRVAELEGS